MKPQKPFTPKFDPNIYYVWVGDSCDYGYKFPQLPRTHEMAHEAMRETRKVLNTKEKYI